MKVLIQNIDQTTFNSLALLFSKTPIEELEPDSEFQPEYYQVVGTVSNTVNYIQPKHVQQIIDLKEKDLFLEELSSCDIIVWDVFTDTADWLVSELIKSKEVFQSEKVVIGISNVLTWTRTVTDPDDPELSINESDYKKRRAHLDFRVQISTEREILRLGKEDKFKTFIVCAGLIHHGMDSIYHYMFKQAWTGKDVLCYGDGENVLPNIHLDDLCSIIVATCQTKPALRYILAVDSAKSTLIEICQSVSTAMGTGHVVNVPFETCLLDQSITKVEYELLRVNLRLDSGTLKELPIQLKYESGFVENITALVTEYKKVRGFSPIRVVLYGPPGIGKSTYASYLSKYYSVPVIQPFDLAASTLAEYEKKLSSDSESEVEPLLIKIKEAMTTNNGEIPTEYIIQFIKEKFQTMPCQNQGYILDGCNFSTELVASLFTAESEEGEIPVNPEIIISLEASDAYLNQKTMELSEAELVSKYGSEAEYLKMLANFRENDLPDASILNYFDEQDVMVRNYLVEEGNVEEFMVKAIGNPRNYGPSKEELQKLEFELKELKRVQEEELLVLENKRTDEEVSKKAALEMEWRSKIQTIKQEEEEMLEAHAAPLRTYLMKYVMPVLSTGLVEVCKMRPDDPIDYLAEYLLKSNIHDK